MSGQVTVKYRSTYRRIFRLTIDDRVRDLSLSSKVELIREKIFGVEFDVIDTDGVSPANRLEIVDETKGQIRIIVDEDYWAPGTDKYYYFVRETTDVGELIDYPLVGRFTVTVGV